MMQLPEEDRMEWTEEVEGIVEVERMEGMERMEAMEGMEGTEGVLVPVEANEMCTWQQQPRLVPGDLQHTSLPQPQPKRRWEKLRLPQVLTRLIFISPRSLRANWLLSRCSTVRPCLRAACSRDLPGFLLLCLSAEGETCGVSESSEPQLVPQSRGRSRRSSLHEYTKAAGPSRQPGVPLLAAHCFPDPMPVPQPRLTFLLVTREAPAPALCDVLEGEKEEHHLPFLVLDGHDIQQAPEGSSCRKERDGEGRTGPHYFMASLQGWQGADCQAEPWAGDQPRAPLTTLLVEADLGLVLLPAVQHLLDALQHRLAGLGPVEEAAAAVLLHDLGAGEAGEVAEAIGAVDDGEAAVDLRVGKDEVAV